MNEGEEKGDVFRASGLINKVAHQALKRRVVKVRSEELFVWRGLLDEDFGKFSWYELFW